MIHNLRFSFMSKSTQIRSSLEPYLPWIRSLTGMDGSELAQLRFDHSLTALAAGSLFGEQYRTEIHKNARIALESKLQRVEFPPDSMPAASLRLNSLPGSSPGWSARWLDCPVALYFPGFDGPVIAVNVPFVDGSSRGSDWREVVIAKRVDIPSLLGLMKDEFPGKYTMKIIGEKGVNIQPQSWDDLVLDPSIIQLVKDDYRLFLQREEWYKQHRLPFRRGYLLHGPPGNGKSSVIRAMLSTPGISGFTMNPFRPFADDDMLSTLFNEAAQCTPAVIVLEDLDRWFPTEQDGDSKPQISLQQLLNSLDGVGNQDGIIVVATANRPSILDPAILRRPGRFDRVVGFKEPSRELRKRYLCQMNPEFDGDDLDGYLAVTEGFSFAQLRETYILAGQEAMEEGGPISRVHLTRAARILLETMAQADRRWNAQVGF